MAMLRKFDADHVYLKKTYTRLPTTQQIMKKERNKEKQQILNKYEEDLAGMPTLHKSNPQKRGTMISKTFQKTKQPSKMAQLQEELALKTKQVMQLKRANDELSHNEESEQPKQRFSMGVPASQQKQYLQNIQQNQQRQQKGICTGKVNR